MSTNLKAESLLLSLDNLNFHTYIDLCDELTNLKLVGEALSKQATIYSYYGGLEEEAKRRESLLKAEMDTFIDEEHTKFREKSFSSTRKPTARDMEAYVQSQPKYSQMKTELVEVSFRKGLLTKLLRALEHRKDMLVQLSAKARKEMELS